MIFPFFRSGSGVLGCDWRRRFFKKGDVFFLVTTSLFCKVMCTITTPSKNNCRFLVLKKNHQHVRAGFALFTVVELKFFVSWKVYIFFAWTCWTIYISNNIFNWVLRLFKKISPLTKPEEIQFCLFSKTNSAHLTSGSAVKTLIVASTESLKSLLCTQVHLNTLCSGKRRSQ